MARSKNVKQVNENPAPEVNEIPEEVTEDVIDEEEVGTEDTAGEDPAEDKPVDQEVKPGKFKRFVKGAWKWTKRLLPIGAAYGAGFATKAALNKVVGTPATPTTDGTPLITENPTTISVDISPATDPVKIAE